MSQKTRLEQMQAKLADQQKEIADLIPDYDRVRSLSTTQRKQLVQVAKQQIRELSKTTAPTD